MFDRILVPLNGSSLATQALRVGAQLADRWDCELHVLTLVERTQIESGVQHIIERQVAIVKHRPKVDIRAVSYSVPEDIAGEFDRVDNSLIVMGTWARGRSAGLVSNNAEDVLRLVRSPMIVLGSAVEIGTDWPTGPMLIATDGSRFAQSIVADAAKLAKALTVEPRLITVIESSSVSADITPPAEANSLAGLAGVVESITGLEAYYDVLHGNDPGQQIVDHARRYNASLIAMSTHGRSGFNRLAFDSVAMDVVRHAHCPVVLNRPPLARG